MNPLINHLEKTLARTEARVHELRTMLDIAKANAQDPRQQKLPAVK